MIAAEAMTANETDLLQDAREKIDNWFDLAEELYPSYTFNRPLVNFNLRGKTAGKAFCRGGKRFELRLNEVLLRENFERFSARTIPHEVAHFITQVITQGRGKSHGWEWKRIMRQFGCEVSRCHNYDVTNSTVQSKTGGRKKQYAYSCSCQTMMFTIIRHRRAKERGGKCYRCRTCGEYLIYSPQR